MNRLHSVMTMHASEGKIGFTNPQRFFLQEINDEEFKGEISITEWDLRNRYTSKISETNIKGTNAVLMKFSHDGSKLFVLYEGLESKEKDHFVQFLSIFDSEYMTLLKQGQIGSEAECFEDLSLLWKGTYVYGFDRLSDDSKSAHKFYEITAKDYADPEKESGSMKQFSHQLKETFNLYDDQVCFDDAREGKVFTIKIKFGDYKDGDLMHNTAEWTMIDILNNQNEDLCFMFPIRQITSITNLVMNKECTHAFFQDKETKFITIILDL